MATDSKVARPVTMLSRIKAAVPLGSTAKLFRSNGLKPIPALVWDQEFGSGQWDWLGGLTEMPRNAVIAGYYRSLGASGAILDVGCGAGVLQPMLDSVGYERYLGVDLSKTAIEQAQGRVTPTTRFETANAESFMPPERFDVIIFNETLFYMSDPANMLQRYSQYLTPGGKYIISLWLCREYFRVWRDCKPKLKVLDDTRVVRNNASWRVRLCTPAER